jgi:hypothetical protein
VGRGQRPGRSATAAALAGQAIAGVLPGDAQVPVRPLLCVHGGGWPAGPPPPVVGDVRAANPRELPDIVHRGLRAQEDEVELAIDRLLEVLRPAV